MNAVTRKPSEESTPSAAGDSSKMSTGFGNVDVTGDLDKSSFRAVVGVKA